MKLVKLFLLLCLTSTFATSLEINNQIDSFEKAKKVLPSIFNFHNRDIYCNCPYKEENNKLIVTNCKDYVPRNMLTKNGRKNERAKRIEWEHIVPAENFGRQLPCWRNGNDKCVDSSGKAFKGRNCCKKIDANFRAMEADLRNLVPVVGELNADRSNFRYAQDRGDLVGQYGKCEFKVDFNERKVFVRDEIKGLLARTYLYFVETYNMQISKSDLALYRAWDKTFKANDFEKEWLRRVVICKDKFQKDRTNSIKGEAK